MIPYEAHLFMQNMNTNACVCKCGAVLPYGLLMKLAGTTGKLPPCTYCPPPWTSYALTSAATPVAPDPACDCGATKAMGAQAYAPGHSGWCSVAESL